MFLIFITLLHLLELAASDKSPRRASVDDEARWNETLVVDLSIRGSSAIPSRSLASIPPVGEMSGGPLETFFSIFSLI